MAQSGMYDGRNVYGSFHRPLVVKNEYGTLDYALLAYKDDAVEVYVPDVTAADGYMRLRSLLLSKTFTTMLYVYGKSNERTDSYIVSVNVLKHVLNVRVDPFAKAAEFTFADAPHAISHAISNIIPVMQHEIIVQNVVP